MTYPNVTGKNKYLDKLHIHNLVFFQIHEGVATKHGTMSWCVSTAITS